MTYYSWRSGPTAHVIAFFPYLFLACSTKNLLSQRLLKGNFYWIFDQINTAIFEPEVKNTFLFIKKFCKLFFSCPKDKGSGIWEDNIWQNSYSLSDPGKVIWDLTDLPSLENLHCT